MAVMIGSARIDEKGKISGGKPGDQKQTSANDTKGEVSMQSFYVHSKGWYVIRPKDRMVASKIADLMILACNNSNLGYDQTGRLGVIQKGILSKEPTECDCSSLVRACVKEATGKDPGNFSTLNEVDVLSRTGLFEKKVEYKSGMTLLAGDILVTKTKGHTAIVTIGDDIDTSAPTTAKKSITEIAKEVLAGRWGNGIDRKKRLSDAGYNYAAIQNEVNRILKS